MARIYGSNRNRFFSVFFALALLSLSGCSRSERVTTNPSNPAEIPFNTKITFGLGGSSEIYKSSGWSKTEEKFTWTEGMSAQLRLPVEATNEPVALKIRMAALIKPLDLPSQPVEIYINGQKIAEWQVGDTAEFVAEIPHDLTKLGGVLAINIKTPKAISPKALGLSADPRVLGICCFDLELSKG